MAVIATAGHVDHGKSTLVRALTGMEPDRWAEEQRRGMTIDLGYAWTDIDGIRLCFVDVPGHERFVASMLAGVGPVSSVLLVVAADDGWSRQTQEHAEAIAALGVTDILLAVTRSDVVDPAVALNDSRVKLAALGIPAREWLAVSGRTGAGLPDLRAALGRLAARQHDRVDRDDQTDHVVRTNVTDLTTPPRLWVDRAFTVRGVGTVVTGTLGAGKVEVGDRLWLRDDQVSVRSLQSCGESTDLVAGPTRVALNLRGVPLQAVGRGDQLTRDPVVEASVLDLQVLDLQVPSLHDLPNEVMLHLGTTSVAARWRPLGDGFARVTLQRPTRIRVGDRAAVRVPGEQRVPGGSTVLAVDPPSFDRRGAAARRVAELSARAARRADELSGRPVRPGPAPTNHAPADHAPADRAPANHAPTGPAPPNPPVAESTTTADDPGLIALLAWLEVHPLDAPTTDQVRAWGPTPRGLAMAARTGQLVRHTGLFLHRDIHPAAARLLASLAEPFTVGEAARALGTTRRVAVPVLERLDALGRTVRDQDGRRRVRP